MARKLSSATIHDVARAAQVSPATVSRFVNGTAPVSIKTARRIELAMQSLRYVPSAAARQLATQKTYTIGLLLTDVANEFFPPLTGSIESFVQEEKYNLLLASRVAQAHPDAPIPLGPHNTDGLIVFAGSLSENEISDFYRAGHPMVLIYRTAPPGIDVPSVMVGNKRAVKSLLDHVIEKHNRRGIVLVDGPYYQEDAQRRKMGYLEALAAHNIPYDPALVVAGNYNRRDAYRAMKQLLKRNTVKFDAVFTGNDDSAIGVLKVLQEHNLRIPQDVSLVGFDDIEIAMFLNPPLTTVNAPTAEVGRMAAQYLFQLINGEEIPLTTLLPSDLVVRRSCGCVE